LRRAGRKRVREEPHNPAGVNAAPRQQRGSVRVAGPPTFTGHRTRRPAFTSPEPQLRRSSSPRA
jgi:hypothetical protein